MQQQSMGVCTVVEIGLCDLQNQIHNCATACAQGHSLVVDRDQRHITQSLGGPCVPSE